MVMVLASIRAALEEEPSPAAVRAQARRWEAALWHLVDEVTREHAA